MLSARVALEIAKRFDQTEPRATRFDEEPPRLKSVEHPRHLVLPRCNEGCSRALASISPRTMRGARAPLEGRSNSLGIGIGAPHVFGDPMEKGQRRAWRRREHWTCRSSWGSGSGLAILGVGLAQCTAPSFSLSVPRKRSPERTLFWLEHQFRGIAPYRAYLSRAANSESVTWSTSWGRWAGKIGRLMIRHQVCVAVGQCSGVQP